MKWQGSVAMAAMSRTPMRCSSRFRWLDRGGSGERERARPKDRRRRHQPGRRRAAGRLRVERRVPEVKTGGPTAKSFNINFALLYDRLGDARARPCNLWCGDEEARDVVEQLNRDAGYEPVYAGGLENAGLQESFIGLVFAINRGGVGPFLYRMAPPDEL